MRLGKAPLAAPWILYLSLAVLACGGPSQHETLLKDGRQAESQERWEVAATLYQRACDLKPTDTASCRRAQEMRDYSVNLRSYQAKKLCEEGRLQECLSTISSVRDMKTLNHGKVVEVLELAALLSQKACLASDKERLSLVPALAELRCLVGNRAALWEAPTFRGHYEGRSRQIGGQLIERSKRAAQESFGTQLSFMQAAQCLVPLSPADLQSTARAQESFLAHAQTHFALQYTAGGGTSSAPGTCLDIVTKFGRGLRCDGSQSESNAQLPMTAEVFSLRARWKRSHQDRRESVRYKAGTETRANPNYEQTRVEYELADGRYRDAERVANDREARCRETREDIDCDAFESAEDTSEDRLRELNQARQRFHSEPSTITEDVYKDHSYVVRDHRWAAPFRASIKVGSSTANAEITEIVYTDSEQPGFSEAGVRADSFEPPSENFFRDESGRWLISRIESQLLSEMNRRANEMVDTCKGDRINCWARASYWLGTSNLGLPLLQQLSADTALPALECTASLL